jgi:hypothetical protein
VDNQAQNHIKPNPLLSFMRQPKIYIRLPSNGQYWPENSLDKTETGEYPVFSMTAKDELMLKIPDAVLSGQAVVEVIQHCMPSIKNAWAIPSIDLDMILIAIRLATYGENMVTPITFGNSDNDLELEYTVDLRQVMDALMSKISWDPAVPVSEDLTIFVKPMTYKQISENAVKTFETQKILQIANNTEVSEDQKITAFRESFNKLTEVTIGIVENSIFRIDTPNGSTTDRVHIKEFIENADKNIFNAVQLHLEKLKNENAIDPIDVPVTDELKEKGITGDNIKIPLVFDPSTFFA